MVRRLLNLGILAHVDAGKTTLTERLLYAAGVIDEVGSVDRGTTQTDTLALERQRGITIRAAVVSFDIGDLTVNLIDTPGHPDFIAEVDRILGVLDGAVLVISAVEGVQPQTRILYRALRRLAVPTLLFVNKIDRAGADEERVLRAINERLTAAAVPMVTTREAGTRAASCVELPGPPAPRLAARTRTLAAHPLWFGSAVTGAGTAALACGIAGLLPAASTDADGPPRGRVFKVERGPRGEKIAHARLFTGTIRTRDRLHLGRGAQGKVTAIAVFDRGPAVRRPAAGPGRIAKLWGLADVQVGDWIGDAAAPAVGAQFAPPTLEAVVVPARPEDRGRLWVALTQLAEQDPLIDVRQEFAVTLYGEVQKEVIQATLLAEYGLEVSFRDSTTICIERPLRSGSAVISMGDHANPHPATVGLRIDPAAAGSGVAFELDVDIRSVPMYVYKTVEAFTQSMTETVLGALDRRAEGWRVTDCRVTMTDCAYAAPSTTAAHFRKLTPVVLECALERAGTRVCEPLAGVMLEVPTETVGAVLPALIGLGAASPEPVPRGSLCAIRAVLPAARLRDLQRRLPGLTSGEGVLESEFAGYRPV